MMAMGFSRFGIAIATMLLSSAAQSATPWYEARSDHFVIYSPGTEVGVRDFATKLERFDKALRVSRDLADRPSDRVNPLIVYVLPNVASVRNLCAGGPGRKRGGCPNVAGFYHPRASGSVAFTPRRSGDGSQFDLNAQTVLFHEYAHHFMYANYSAAYPGWFSEGFAEFNGTARLERDGSVGLGLPPLHRAYGLLTGNPLPLAKMLAPENRKMNDAEREALYGRGWLVTHYLTFAPTRKGQLGKYLTALNAGKPSIEAAKDAFGDLKVMERDVERYLGASRMSYIRLAPDRLPIGQIAIRRLTDGEAAMMPVRMRSERGVDAASAPAVAADARRIAEPFAADPGVQTWLAEAEYDAGQDDAAEAAADRAIAADPKALDAMLYKGRARIRRASQAKTTDPAIWKEARSWFVKANALEPDKAEPLMLFYDSFRAAGLRPHENAIAGLHRAFELAPQDRGLRFRVAREYMRAGDRASARLALAPLAYNPHAGPDNPALRMIEAIGKASDAELATAADAIADDDSD